MIMLERQVQHVRPEKWGDLEAMDKKFNEVEKALGFPAKRRYRLYIGGSSNDTLVIEREWPSLAAFEAAYEKAFASAEWQALGAEVASIITSNQDELYACLS